MSKSNIHGVELGITSNVFIRVIDGNTGKYREYSGHNKATKSLLLGLYNFLRGRENTTSYDYAPNWLRVGYGTQTPTFLDTVIQIPMYIDGDPSDNYTTGTDVYQTIQRGKDYLEDTNSITLAVKFYIASNELAGSSTTPIEINEIGLFSRGGIMLARYVLPDAIEKYDNDFIDITWEISMTSIGDGE